MSVEIGLPYLYKENGELGFLVPDRFEAIRPDGRHAPDATEYSEGPEDPSDRAVDARLYSRPAVRWQPNEWGPIWTMTDMRDGRTRVVPARPDDRLLWEIQAATDVRAPLGRPYLVHETRPTTATLLLRAGVDRAVIEAILEQAVLVKSYLHVTPWAARQALEQGAQRLTLTGEVPVIES